MPNNLRLDFLFRFYHGFLVDEQWNGMVFVRQVDIDQTKAFSFIDFVVVQADPDFTYINIRSEPRVLIPLARGCGQVVIDEVSN